MPGDGAEQFADSSISQRNRHADSATGTHGNGMSVSIAVPAVDQDCNDPVTFHRILQSMIGDGLKARYEPSQTLSHGLLVLMLQLKEQESRDKAVKPRAKTAKPQRSAEALL
jgi:hypothetical protein